jgi:hypothetical protein
MEIVKVINPIFEEEGIDISTREKVFYLLKTLEEHHKPTCEHSVRIGMLARRLGAIQNQKPKAGFYGVLHDIGKLKVPRSLLDKCEGFDEEDMKIMRTHVTEGYRILSNAGLPFSAWLALTHHRYQPKFYPSEDEMFHYSFPIPNVSPSTRLLADTWASLVGIADAYDAAKMRRNDRFEGVILSPENLEKWLIEEHPSSERIIREAYKNKVLE